MSPLLLIRVALLSGVLLFGAVVFFMRRSGDPLPNVPAQAESLAWIGRGLWMVASIGTFLLWRARQQAESVAKKQQWSIIGYAMGESVALFGGVVWYLTGTPVWYVPGVLFLAALFFVFPARLSDG